MGSYSCRVQGYVVLYLIPTNRCVYIGQWAGLAFPKLILTPHIYYEAIGVNILGQGVGLTFL